MLRKIYIILVLMSLGNLVSRAQVNSDFNIRVASSARHLEHQNGESFYYIGDTAWELFHRCSREEAEMYLKDRASKDFTVIQAAALAEIDGLNTPNVYGEKPLLNNDPLTPNEEYWEHVDWVVKCAERNGLFIALLPTWGDKVDLLWGVGPVIFDKENSYEYGKWIANRYKNSPNFIWVIGGDRDCNKGNEDVWDAFARGIKSIDKNHLMTLHPRGGTSSSLQFHNAEWLDFNMLQSGHYQRYIDNFKLVNDDYNKLPTKPCLDGEPNYDDHPINWKEEYGWFNEDDVRRSCYWGVFAGGIGAVYGAHPIWQMKTDERESIGDVRHDWKTALKLKGSSQMAHLHKLMREEEFSSLRVDTTIFDKKHREGREKTLALSSDNKIVIYQTFGGEISIEKPMKGSAEVKWYNPRNGQYTQSEKIETNGKFSIYAPVWGIDWIAIINFK